jgi:hypothetical protein
MSAADLLELGRRGQTEALAQRADAARAAAGWDAAAALELAAAWLLAGDPRQADLAFLEADQLAPSLALVPDPWGLWPAPSAPAVDPADQQRLLALAERYRSWRHPDAQWQPLRSLREQLQPPPSQPAPQQPEPGATGFEALLERATARLQTLGGSVPQSAAGDAPADLDAIAGQLSALELRLSDYEARFALA